MKVVLMRDGEVLNTIEVEDGVDVSMDEPLFHRALEKWGKPAQVIMCMEECAELIQALAKFLRSGKMGLPLIDELVDVHIMVEQIRLLVPPEEFKSVYDFKMRRLEQRLKESRD